MTEFIHLHVHSHYSILDGMSKVPDLVNKCIKNGMKAMALTDHGNMYGIKDLFDTCKKINGKPKGKISDCEDEIKKNTDPEKTAELEAKLEQLKKEAAEYVPFKPIIGIETYCAHENFDVETQKGHEKSRGGWHLILIAKNKTGYKSLCKLSSLAFTKGYHYKPRIDKASLEKYHEGLIVCSACIGGEVPSKILQGDIEGAKESVKWFKNLFGDDYYLELQRHKTDKENSNTETFELQEQANKVLIEFAKEFNIKLIATNDVHFVEEEHGEAHDRLICLSTGKDYDDPDRMKYTKQEWLKTPDEMAQIFSDIPEALSNTLEIANKVEVYDINSDPIMPKFPIPQEFGTEEEYRKKFSEKDLFDEFTQDENGKVVLSQEDAEKKIKKLGGYEKLYRIKLEADYLSKLAYEGSVKRYGEKLNEEQAERIKFELHIMKTMGFPGYFLIVQDYIRGAREELGVSVGPGRGSAAGSVVAYCLGITNLDPLKYDLLFERFLNPDRISLPDIDVDFDDDGRGKVLDWVTHKYGAEKVAHIITYGTMATKSSIADVSRVQKIPLPIVNKIKSYIPEKTFEETQVKAVDGTVPKKMPKVNLGTCFKYIPELHQLVDGEEPEGFQLEGQNNNVSSMLKYAKDLEDTNRQIGIHACGVIIGAQDLTDIAPVCTIKDKDSGQDVVVTQYDGHVVESVGLIKMDFLGLKTLSLIKETLKNIKKHRGEDIDIEAIPIDDPETYKLYSEGRTIGTFQFESPGMQKYLKELKPTQISDLIAMNALYRPGPMDYIPTFINRKLGKEPIEYDLPVMEKYLKDTYGVTVYQEQVMLLSRLLAGFTRGQADTLRKAMGKKLEAMLADLKPKFLDGGVKNGHPKEVLEKIWKDWEKFASYAFNKSHAACYGWVAYQTGYLKAHYPAEYMAANLTRNKDSITDVTKFMEECKAMKIEVKGPDVNESELNFSVTKDGGIRFGLGGIKGVGEAAVEAIVKEREKNGPYKDIYNFAERVNLSQVNRRTLENLALAGAFDSFNCITRTQFMGQALGENMTFSEALSKYGSRMQTDAGKVQNSLFGDTVVVEVKKPMPAPTEEWSNLVKLNKEKELVGIYLSAHPLDPYRLEIENYCNATCSELNEINNFKNKDIKIAGIISAVESRTSKSGNPFGTFTLEDFSGGFKIVMFGKDYINYKQYFTVGYALLVKGKAMPKFNDPTDYEFKVQSIEMLNDVKDKMLNGITLKMPISDLNSEMIQRIKKLTERKGSSQLGFQFFDPKNSRISIKMHSRSYRIKIDNDLITKLKDEQIEYSIT
ncbi:MAG: DNA polymerase III subunit alpha [Bacteroidales bacterium]|nr:DNA polymerase III subunit alpha [Bacteroidales bacterium]